MAGTSFPAKRCLTSDLQKNIKEMAKTYESDITEWKSGKHGGSSGKRTKSMKPT